MYPLKSASLGHIPIAVPKSFLAVVKSSLLTSNLANMIHNFANVNCLWGTTVNAVL